MIIYQTKDGLTKIDVVFEKTQNLFPNPLDFPIDFGYNKVAVDYSRKEVFLWNTLKGILNL